MNATPSGHSLESTFAQALEKSDPSERAAYLDQACGADAELRQRVERLLQAHDQAGDFLESPAVQLDPGATAGTPFEPPGPDFQDRPVPGSLIEGPGTQIGPYKLLQEIGQGGMGVVFMAEQEKPVRRRVALKIIKPGMDSAQVVTRFEAERQVLALMDHPNIARVLDAGTTSPHCEGGVWGGGRPYFVMELVKGIPITQYCDEAKLNPRERLELFIPVCQAIQHAHQKGIIHRDVKPSNVMVTLHDGKPVPKIIDFGVAKATDQKLTERTLFTQFGAIIGTPEYMSPEQADLSGLDIDTRSDIFSLGVLLYELLTGTTPLERAKLREAGYAEIMRRIKEEEPPKPSTRLSHSGDRLASIAATRRTEPARLTKLVRGELDWIAIKALEKERTRRYDTANGLARDIQRYLDGDPVEAGPPTASYKLRKLVRKHRAALATVGAFAILLIGASMVSTYLAIRATRAERAAREQAAIAQAVNDFLQQDLLGQADVDNQARPGQKPDPDIKVRTVLDRASERIAGKFNQHPRVEAAIRRTIGRTYHALGLYTSAQTHLEQSLALARRELGDQHGDTLNTMCTVASLYTDQGKYVQAELLYTEALEGLCRIHGEEHPDTLRAMYRLANLFFWRGDFSKAEPLLVSTLRLSRKVLGEDHDTTLITMADLAGLYFEEGKLVESEALTEKAREISRRVRGEDCSMTFYLTAVLAALYQAQGMYAQADELYSQAQEGNRRTRGADDLDTLRWTVFLASSYNDQGKTTQAEELLTEALNGCRRTLGEHHVLTYSTIWARAQTYQTQGRLAEAEMLFTQVLDGYRRTLGGNHVYTLEVLNLLAELYLDERRPEKAEPLLIEAQKIGTSLQDEGTLVAYTAAALARVRLAQRKPSEAEPLARQALAIRQQRHPDLWTRYDALSLVGAALAGQKKFTDAEPLLLQGYEGLKEREERIPFLWRKKRPAEAAARIVDLYDAWGRKDKADEWRKKLQPKDDQTTEKP
ncbi:MAG: tetratricopeptide repeat protein [Isosphaerales bacterium]